MRREDPNPGKAGRKPKMSDQMVQQLAANVTVAALNCRAKTVNQKRAVQEVIAGSESNNSLFDANAVPICRQTVAKYAKQANVNSVTGDVKNSSRIDAMDDIRNPLSFAALLDVVFKHVNPSLFLSKDDVSILLHEWNVKPKILTTADATRILRELNLGNSTSYDRPKQRILTFSGQMFCSGESFTVVKYQDYNFPEEMKSCPMIFGPFQGGLIYYMFYHPNMDLEKVAFFQDENIIIPRAMEVRERLIEEGVSGLRSKIIRPTSSQFSQGEVSLDLMMDLFVENVLPHESESQIREKYKYICIAQDGAIPYMNAVVRKLYERNVEKGRDILNFKFAAACSFLQSPNDVGTMHKSLKGGSCFGSDDFRYGEYVEPTDPTMLAMKRFLSQYIEQADFDTIWPALVQCSEYIPKSFNVKSIKKANMDAGIYPRDNLKILNKCTTFRNYDESQARFVRDLIPVLATHAESGDGKISESVFSRLLQDEIPDDIGLLDSTPVKSYGKQLNDMSISRQRALLLGDKYMDELKNKKAEEERRKKAKEDEVSRLQDLVRSGNPEFLNVSCRNPACNSKKPRLKDSQNGWVSCFHKGCNFQFCGKDACKTILGAHQATCPKKPAER